MSNKIFKYIPYRWIPLFSSWIILQLVIYFYNISPFIANVFWLWGGITAIWMCIFDEW